MTLALCELHFRVRGDGRTKLLHLHGERSIGFLDQVQQRRDGLRPRSGHQLFAQGLGRLHLGGIVLVGSLSLALQVLLVLRGRLGALEAKLSAGARVARLDAVEVFVQLVVLGLCLLRQPFGVQHLVLGGKALRLPCLAVAVHLVG